MATKTADLTPVALQGFEAMARAPAEHVVLAGCTVELVHCIEAGGSDPDQHNHSTLATAESTGGGPEFMTPPWSAAHARAALTEGWNIFESEGSAYGPWQIQRLDWAEETPGAKQLEDDESAWNIVLTGTAAHHAAALAFIRAHNPMDYETMMVHAERNGHQVPGLSL